MISGITCQTKDINSSELIDLYDAVAAMTVYNKNAAYFDGKMEIILKADLDQNKKVNTTDVAIIKNYIINN